MSPSEHHFHTDRPILLRTSDEFGRAPFATRIAEIIGKRTEPASLTIGIYGVWGDGKTSVLNMIRESLANFPLIECVSFNPWRFQDEATLLEAFFGTLAEAIDAKLRTPTESIGSLIKKYSSVLKVGHAGLAETATVVGGAMSGSSLENLRDRIGQLLSQNHIRVVVLIDDIDRMEKSEIQSIFRLVKLTGDFDNTAYVLAFDDAMVARAVGERYSSASESAAEAGKAFLEKIIQVPLQLPRPKREKLRSFCFKMIDALLSDLGLTLEQSEVDDFVYTFTRGLEFHFETPRTAVRYVNGARFAAGLLEGEVYMPDLLILEGIRLIFPGLYGRMRRNPNDFLTRKAQSSNEQQAFVSELVRAETGETDPSSIKSIISLLERLFPRMNTSNYGRDWEDSWAKNKRVASEDYFDRYFSYGLDETDISDRRLQSFLDALEANASASKNKNVFADFLDARNAGTVIGKLRARSAEISPKLAEALVSQLERNSIIFPNLPTLMGFDQPYPQAAILVSKLLARMETGRRFQVMRELVESGTNLGFLVECMRWLSVKGDQQPKLMDDSQVTSLRASLATRIKCNAESLPWDFSHTDSLKLLTLWAWSLGSDEVKRYVLQSLDSDLTRISDLLRSTLGRAYDGNTGMAFEPDFERHSYDTVAQMVDPEELAQQLKSAGISEVAELYDSKRKSNEELAGQFLRLHRLVGEQKITQAGDPAHGDSQSTEPEQVV